MDHAPAAGAPGATGASEHPDPAEIDLKTVASNQCT